MRDDEEVGVNIRIRFGQWFRLHLDGDAMFLVGLAFVLLAGTVVLAVCGSANHVFRQHPIVSPAP